MIVIAHETAKLVDSAQRCLRPNLKVTILVQEVDLGQKCIYEQRYFWKERARKEKKEKRKVGRKKMATSMARAY